jgi:hypothetical protein
LSSTRRSRPWNRGAPAHESKLVHDMAAQCVTR